MWLFCDQLHCSTPLGATAHSFVEEANLFTTSHAML